MSDVARDHHRRDAIAANLREVQERIFTSCRHHGRDVHEITLIAVTKTFPVTDVVHLAALGITDVGENKDQEAKSKFASYQTLEPQSRLRWHLIGQLQRNKAKSVVTYAHMVHSVDRASLADALNNASAAVGRTLPVLLQVDLESGRDDRRGGVHPDDLMDLATHVHGSEHLHLAGLMAVAPLGQDAYAAFAHLAGIRQHFLAEFAHAQILSAGMSHDLDAAIAHGATHVRIGSALLGSRPVVG